MFTVCRKYKGLLALSLVLLFLSFSIDLFGAVNTDAFLGNFKDSEALVSKEIVCEGRYFGDQLVADKGAETARIPKVCDPATLEPYSSQYGLQGRVYTFGYRLLSGLIRHHAAVYIVFARLATALASALCLSLFIIWVRNNFGKIPAIVAMLGIAISPMLVEFGRNLYWALPFMVLPLIFLLFAYKVENKLSAKIIVWVALGFLLYLKYLCGYEYVTTLSIMAAAVVMYYLYMSKAPIRLYIKELAIVLLVCLVSFAAALGTHVCSLGHYTGSTSRAISIVKDRAFARVADSSDYLAYPFSNYEFTLKDQYKITDSYLHISDETNKRSQFWATVVSFLNYALLPVVNIPISLNQPFAGFAQSLTAFVLVMAVLFWNRKKWFNGKYLHQVEALFIAVATGFIGYLSWLFLARPHSLVHAHINGILMYLPMALFGYIIIGLWIDKITASIRSRLLPTSRV